MIEIATQFGNSLDQDDFETTKKLLSQDCEYIIGSDILYGAREICNSYEENMIEGRNKLDKLEWGECQIEKVSDHEFYVHFTDYLTHKGIKHTHKCKQKLTINSKGKITQINHINNPKEVKKLNEYYAKVGIKKAE